MKSDHFDHYTANMELLKEHHHNLWQVMADNPPEKVGELVISPNQLPNLLIKDSNGAPLFLHVEEDPKAEIPAFLKFVPPGSTGVVALFGMGLGYTPTAIIEERPDIAQLVIFEADKAIFHRALQCTDLTSLLSAPNVIISIGEQDNMPGLLNPCLLALKLEHIHELRHLPSFQLHPEIYEQLKTTFHDFASILNINSNTISRFGSFFLKNRMRQMTTMGHDYLLESLKDAFKGIPAILVAGGPSLNKNIDQLPQLTDKALIISIDTTIPALIKRGITANFATSLDPQQITIEKFADYRAQVTETNLIASPAVTYEVSKYLQFKNTFWTFSGNELEAWIMRVIGGSYLHEGGGTVAHLNLHAAILMGCSPIIIIGQDLAFSEGEDHADDTVLTDKDSVQRTLSEKKNILYTKSWSGGEVPTVRIFMSYKKTFENIIKNHPGTYINATEGGAHIEGTEPMTLQSAASTYLTSQYDSPKIIGRILETLKNPDSKKITSQLSKTNEECQLLHKRVKKLKSAIHSIIKDLCSYQKEEKQIQQFSQLSTKLQNKISKMEKNDKKIDKSHYWPLLQDITIHAVKANSRKLHALRKDQEETTSYLSWLKDAVSRIKTINDARLEAIEGFIEELTKTLSFYQDEQKIIKNTCKKNVYEKNYLNLATHYMEHENIRLATPLLNTLLNKAPNSAEINFQLGRVAAYQNNFEKMEYFFKIAENLDASFKTKAESIKLKLSDAYIPFALKYTDLDKQTYCKMLFKGLNFTNKNHKINTMIQKALTAEIEHFQLSSKKELNDEISNRILFWKRNIAKNKNIASIIPNELLKSLYYFYGKIEHSKNSMDTAASWYLKSLYADQNMAASLVGLAEISFYNGNIQEGGNYLKKATEIDISYAYYWEELGDTLFQIELHEEALSAYENYFLLQPEHKTIFKKIGDCFLKLNAPEAAREAYLEYKNHTQC